MKNMAKKGTILFDFLIFMIIAIVIVVSAITYFNISGFKESFARELNSTVKYLMFIVEVPATEVMRTENSDKLSEITSIILKQTGTSVMKIEVSKFIEGEKVKIVYSTLNEDVGKEEDRIEFSGNTDKDVSYESQVILGKTMAYKYSQVIPNKGVIDIYLSLAGVIKEYKAVLLKNLIVGLITVIFAVAATAFLLLNKVYKPIMKLRGEVKKISNGEVAYKVKSDTNNELSELAEDINEMKEFIWEKSISDKFSHPITGLPGLMNLIEKVTDKIDNKTVFSLINISIENFEKYVLRAGFVKGEDYIRTVYNMIVDIFNEQKITDYECYQIRENSIAIVLNTENAENIGKEIASKFEDSVIPMYEVVPVKDGSGAEENNQIIINNIEGKENVYTRTKLIISVINNENNGEITSYKDIEDKILEIETLYLGMNSKSFCKVSGKLDVLVSINNEEEVKEEPVKELKKESKEDDLLDGLEEL